MKNSSFEKLFAAGPGGRASKTKLSIPSPLVGCWRGGGARWNLSDMGVWSAIEGPHTWSVSADGQVLVWNGWTLTRISGAGLTYVGVWSGTDTGSPIEISFNADNSYKWFWVNEGDSTYGYYIVVGNMLTVYEKRADVTATNTQITFTTVWGDAFSGTYTLNGDNWHIDFGGGTKADYLRVSC